MEIVVDTNVLISALVKPAKSREIICSSNLVLYSPEHLILESFAHKEEIIRKSGIGEFEFKALMAVLLSKINIVPDEEFAKFIKPALKLVSHPEDAPFIALSISKSLPLWSDDKLLKKQPVVKVFSTSKLIKELDL